MNRPTSTPSPSTARPATPAAGPIAAEEVIEELVRRGFRSTGHAGHVVLERDGRRVVVPGRGRVLPERVVRIIECGLEPQLGHGWLSHPEPPRPRPGRRVQVGERTVHVLDVVVAPTGSGEPTCVFLADDFSVVGFGADRDAALRDLKGAAACWMAVDADDVVLMTPSVV